MTSLKPIKLYAHGSTPNPVKVAIILEELSLAYETSKVEWDQMHAKPFTDINPNGRVPAIHDPNTGITLWESGAIIQYLTETYDKEAKLTYRDGPERHLQNQWLFFQASGQGPYYGQVSWFQNFHPEKLPSAKERYVKEVERVTGVLDAWLKDHEFLVGDKLTYADLVFAPYGRFVSITGYMNQEGKLFEDGKYPAYRAWMEKILQRPSVKKTANLE